MASSFDPSYKCRVTPWAGSTSSTVCLPPNPSQLWPPVANVFRVASRKHLRAEPSEHNTKVDAKLKVHQWIPSASNTSPAALLVAGLPFSVSKTRKMNQNIGLPIAYHVSSVRSLYTLRPPSYSVKSSVSPISISRATSKAFASCAICYRCRCSSPFSHSFFL